MKAAAQPVQRPPMRACSSSMAPAASPTIRAARSPTARAPATWSSPTTPRRCRRASRAATCRAARRSRFASPAVARSRPTRSRRFLAVVFGAGDWRTRTEDRPLPPPLAAGDTLALGPLAATVVRVVAAPRLVELRFAGAADAIRAGIARHGRPVQYAHVAAPLALWDVWTAIAAQPVAFEAPSAGFVLDWQLLAASRARGVGFATLTHAAGLSSTGDAALDARLPFDEPYHLPAATVAAVQAARQRGGRVVAIGTTVARALEHAAAQPGGLRAGAGHRRQPARPSDAARASSTRSSAARTSRARATTSCCARSSTTRRSTRDRCGARIASAATARTSSATRSWSSAASRRRAPRPSRART